MNNIQCHRQAVRDNIMKSFGADFSDVLKAEENDLEKAHKVGDVHPNGKWVWVEYAPGKFDWRGRKDGRGTRPKAPVAHAPKTPPQSKNLSKISQVEEYAKSLNGVKFADAKTGFDGKKSKAFELTYPNGGKLFVDFYSDYEYTYNLTDSNGNRVINVNSTRMTEDTDWEHQLNPNKLISDRLDVMKRNLTKLKGEATKARKRMINSNDFTDRYHYEKAEEEVREMNSKIQKFENLKGTF